MPVRRLLVLSAGVFLLVSACAPAPSDDFDISPVPPEVTTSAFPNGGDIPVEYTCDGDDISPPLSWDTHPDAVEDVLVFEDLDAPGGTFSHWLVIGLPPPGFTRDDLDAATSGTQLASGNVSGLYGR